MAVRATTENQRLVRTMAGRISAEAYWGGKAAEYDDFIRRVVPRYDDQLDHLFAYLPERADHVLELGCGTGNVSLRLAARWPGARFTFVDAAPEMTDVTRARLAAEQPQTAERSRFVVARFEEMELERATYDVAVASLSLHHVRDVATVYPRLAPALARGGRLMMLDGVRAATSAEHDTHMELWASFWVGRLSDEERAEVVEHIRQHDVYRTRAEHFSLLEDAGFLDPDCLWRDGIFTLITARR
jgi:ubiquinone/menaquinone biosynthesis C-methylase UbiE